LGFELLALNIFSKRKKERKRVQIASLRSSDFVGDIALKVENIALQT